MAFAQYNLFVLLYYDYGDYWNYHDTIIIMVIMIITIIMIIMIINYTATAFLLCFECSAENDEKAEVFHFEQALVFFLCLGFLITFDHVFLYLIKRWRNKPGHEALAIWQPSFVEIVG